MPVRLGLGTVQFGVDYGISNESGRTSCKEAAKILALAQDAEVDLLDTAHDYGASEEVLGELLDGSAAFRIVTKTPRLDRASSREVGEVLSAAFSESLSRLGNSNVYGLLVHDADDLLSENGPAIVDALGALRDRGLAAKIGFSAYTGDQIERVLERFRPDLVQVPVSVFDQRLLHDGTLAVLKSLGVEVHVRSSFLQGLLLMEPSAAIARFPSAAPTLLAWRSFVSEHGEDPAAAALCFARSLGCIDYVIIGVNSAAQLEHDLRAFAVACPLRTDDFAPFAIEDDNVLDPRRWV